MLSETLRIGATTENGEQQKKPYVVSADIRILLEKWVKEKGFVLPNGDFFQLLRSDFTKNMRQIMPNFQLVPEEELQNGIKQLIDKVGLPTVAIDRVYYQDGNMLDINRLVDKDNRDVGLGRRSGTSPLLEQFRKIRQTGVTEVALVDDVVFSGGLLQKTSGILGKMGIGVPVVVAAITVGEGEKQLMEKGITVEAVRKYPEGVVDQVCERDFYPGVPYSGRSRYSGNGENVGVPYILPFGDVEKWASIPNGLRKEFSQACLRRSALLFGAIEAASGRPVLCRDLDRGVASLPRDGTRFVEALTQVNRRLSF